MTAPHLSSSSVCVSFACVALATLALPAAAQITTRASVTSSGAQTSDGVRRYYSAWYRNASTTFCPPATANVTNGLMVDW